MTAMELVISEITMRATAKVLGPGAHPQRIEAVASPLAEAILDLVVAQGNATEKPIVKLSTYLVWELWNQILDEIEKEIPIVSNIEVVLTERATRAERRQVTDRIWSKAASKPIRKQE